MKNRIFYTLILTFSLTYALFAQNNKQQLANQYFNAGEYEKAAILYKELWNQFPSAETFYDKYLESLLESLQYDEAQRSIDQRIKKSPDDPTLLIKKAKLLSLQGDEDSPDKLYREAIGHLRADRNEIGRLGYAFQSEGKYDLAMEVYERGATLMKDTLQFVNQLRTMAQYVQDNERFIRYGLLSIAANTSNFQTMKMQFQRSLVFDDQPDFQSMLYEYIQRYPDRIEFAELLQWSFIQQDNYQAALRQARALDRRLEENGHRVFELGKMAINNGAYEVGIEAFQYIVDNKSINNNYHITAQSEIIKAQIAQLPPDNRTPQQLQQIVDSYEQFFAKFGKNARSAFILMDYARFQNRYLQDTELAMSTLKEIVALKGVPPPTLARAKIELGDMYLFNGDRWEATLLYAQVDKDFPEEELGEIARYKNAMLSYYVGDFEWAQEQFDILKTATTRLIANDAIDRSVFIMDNLGLDTTARPLSIYADAELRIFQQHYQSAFQQLDALVATYPDHGLEDDVFYLKANACMKQNLWTEAAGYFGTVALNYPEDIRADNSLFYLAQLYDNQFGDQSSAAKLYEKIFIEYSNSTFAVFSRKRYRELAEKLGAEQIEEEGLAPDSSCRQFIQESRS